jgi:superfamily II DNA or RNA helicase
LKWKGTYKSGESNDNLLEDLYIPALKCAARYDRAVGYFSPELLVRAAEGVSSLVSNSGTMRLIIGNPVSNEEYEAIQRGELLKNYSDKLANVFESLLDGENGDRSKYKISLLTWLIAKRHLEIKFAFTKQGMYHDKLGIIVDSSGDRIVFTGTANETIYGFDPIKNKESLSVFPSWKESIFEEWGLPHVRDFERLWEDTEPDSITIEIPSETYQKIASHSVAGSIPDITLEKFYRALDEKNLKTRLEEKPAIPPYLFGKEFTLKNHQREALESWQANNYRGILRLATGSGKTITAVYGLVRLYESWGRLAVVIAVPYLNLARQWKEVLSLFGIDAIGCYDDKSKWTEVLHSQQKAFRIRARSFLCIVVVNDTLRSDVFQHQISNLSSSELMFIGDECHRHGSMTNYVRLPDAGYRLGLSATPFIDDDDESGHSYPDQRKARLVEYYGPVVADYDLEDAINEGVLCPYRYYAIGVHLTESEQEEYENLSSQIAAAMSFAGDIGEISPNLKSLFGKRSRLLGSARNKIAALRCLLEKNRNNPKNHTIFYCAEGESEHEEFSKSIEDVSNLLHELEWKSSRFTARENAGERKKIMDNFLNGNIDALVSMKVLDEGIDIPLCRTAYILASTRNPRQYVQRRGRILRKHASKEYAVIYDFLIKPARGFQNSKASISLMEAEEARAHDFRRLAQNKTETIQEGSYIG